MTASIDTTQTTDEPAAGRESLRGPGLLAAPGVVVGVHVASLVVGYLGLLLLMRGTWFRGDDFEFLANRVGPDPRLSIWIPHNEHWSTGPILIWRFLYDSVGMTSVVPFLAFSLAAHVLAAHLLWRLMRRMEVGAWPATGLAATFVVLGAGHENITWAFQLGFMGSLALGLGALLLLTSDTRPALVGAVVLGVVSLTFSGISVVLAGMAVLYLLAGRRLWEAGVYAAATGAVYVTWYALAGRFAGSPPHSSSTSERLANAAPWAWQAVTSALEALVSAPGSGWLLAAALTAGVAVRLRRMTSRPGGVPTPVVGLVVALMGGLVAQVGSLAVQRGDVSYPDTSRYAYIIVALLLPLLGLALSGHRPRFARALVGLFVGYLAVTQALVLVANERPLEQPVLRDHVLGMAALIESGEQLFPTDLAVDVDVESVGAWAARGDLGDLSAVPPDLRSDARVLTTVRLEPVAPDGAVPGGLLSAGDDPVESGCASTVTTPGDLAATLDLSPGTTVSVTAVDGGTVAFQVVDPGPASSLVSVPVQPNQTYWFEATESLRVDLVAIEGQPLRICG